MSKSTHTEGTQASQNQTSSMTQRRTRRTTARSVALAIAVGLVGPTVLVVGTASAAILTVCATGGQYTTIQAAVTAATAGDTISVCAGTYTENVSIDKNITLLGPNNSISPNSADPLVANASRTAEAIVSPTADGSGNAKAFLITGVSTTDVTITGFKVELPVPTGGNQYFVFMENVPLNELTLQKNLFTGGTQAAIGSFVLNFQTAVSARLVFEDNRIFSGLTSNGVWVQNTAAGSRVELAVSNNVVLDNRAHAMNITGGAAKFGTISGNWIGNSETGVAGVNGFGIRQNGIILSGAFDGLSVSHNSFTNIESAAISLYSDISGAISITGNQITGYNNTGTTGAIFGRLGTPQDFSAVVVSGNSFSNRVGSSRAVSNRPGNTLTATNNWWGQASGPDAGQIYLEGSSQAVSMPYITSYTNDPSKNGQPGFWPIDIGAASALPASASEQVLILSSVEGSPGLTVPASSTPVTVSVSVINPTDLPGEEIPFALADAKLLDIDVAGTFEAGAEFLVCVDGSSPLKLWHFPGVDGPWVDISRESPVVVGKVCGVVTSFSPFALAAPALISTTTTVTCSPSSVTYTGSALTPCSATVTGAGLSLTPTPSYSNNTNAGTASASYTYVGDATYASSSDSEDFTINKATTAIVYTGTTYVASGVTTASLSAQLSGATACISGQSITFWIDRNDDGVQDTGELFSNNTTNSGIAITSATGLVAGVYKVAVTFASTSNCTGAMNVADLVVAGQGNASTGEGDYTVSGTDRVNLDYNAIVKSTKNSTTVSGKILWQSKSKSRFKGSVNAYTKITCPSGVTGTTCGLITGIGTVTTFIDPNPSILGDEYWGNPVTGVSFRLTVADGQVARTSKGMKDDDRKNNPDYVRMDFPAQTVNGENPASWELLKDGNIVVK